MTGGRKLLLALACCALGACMGPALAQQAQQGWQADTRGTGQQATTESGTAGAQSQDLPPNTTVVPRTRVEAKGGVGTVALSATLTADGQGIEQGLTWRVYRDLAGADGKARLVVANREAAPTLRLEAGEYYVVVAFGRAHLTRKITVTGERTLQERFVLNAGGLRLIAVLGTGEGLTEKVSYDVLSDERDQYGQRIKVVSGLKPGVVVRMNAGIYSIVSTYGDANAVARADVTVEAGKLTEAKLIHPAASVTLKLVARSGGDAMADTQWSIATSQGEAVKESVGAVPTHILAPGTYTVSAKHGGQVYTREFSVKSGDAAQVEVVVR